MSAIENTTTIQTTQDFLKGKTLEELLAIITAAAAEAKKAAKVAAKSAPKEKAEKKGSMPKGVVPPQLRKPRAWVDFTLAHANQNGWESFAVKGQEEPMPASVMKDGKYVFEKDGKPMNNKQAMSLSKQRWDRKENKGTRKDLYDEFESTYVDEAPIDSEPKAETPKKEVKPKKSEEEKLAEKEAKAAKKKEEKLAEKEAKKAEKVETKKTEKVEVKKTEVEEKKVEEKKVEEKTEKVEEKKAPVVPKKKIVKSVKEEKDTFTCENDGALHHWEWKGKHLLRNFDNQVWAATTDGEMGEWQGVFDSKTLKFDTSVEEPIFYEEESSQ